MIINKEELNKLYDLIVALRQAIALEKNGNENILQLDSEDPVQNKVIELDNFYSEIMKDCGLLEENED